MDPNGIVGALTASLYSAHSNLKDEHLVRRLDDTLRPTVTGWHESLAAKVLTSLENQLKEGGPISQEMKAAYEKASQVIAAVFGFAKEHPVFCAFVALGILVIVMPWAVEALGFAVLGPVEGTFAAWWQSTYGGYVPKGSLFSFFQRLGMV